MTTEQPTTKKQRREITNARLYRYVEKKTSELGLSTTDPISALLDGLKEEWFREQP